MDKEKLCIFLKGLQFQQEGENGLDIYTFDMTPGMFYQNFFEVQSEDEDSFIPLECYDLSYNGARSWLKNNFNSQTICENLDLGSFNIFGGIEQVYSWNEDMNEEEKEWNLEKFFIYRNYKDTIGKAQIKNIYIAFEKFFNEHLGIYTFQINTKRKEILEKIIQDKPPYLCDNHTRGYIFNIIDEHIEQHIQTIYEHIELGEEYGGKNTRINEPSIYIQGILCSMPEKVAWLFHYIYEHMYDYKWKDDFLNHINNFEKYVTTQEGIHFKEHIHRYNIGMFYYRGEPSITMQTDEEIITPFWGYNRKTKNFYSLFPTKKHHSFKGAKCQFAVLEKMIDSEELYFEVSTNEYDNFKNIQSELGKSGFDEQFKKLITGFHKDNRCYIFSLRKQ